VISKRQEEGSALNSEQSLPKLTEENTVSITNYTLRPAMILENIIQVSLGNFHSNVGMFQSNKIGKFAQPVYYNKNNLITKGGRKSLNEIHRNIFLNFSRDRQRL